MKQIKDAIYILPNAGTAQEFIFEFISVLKKAHATFSTHSMNEGALYLEGQKNMLEQIITALEEELNEETLNDESIYNNYI